MFSLRKRYGLGQKLYLTKEQKQELLSCLQVVETVKEANERNKEAESEWRYFRVPNIPIDDVFAITKDGYRLNGEEIVWIKKTI